MKIEKSYHENSEMENYKIPECWGVCFADSDENNYTFYPTIVFGDNLETLHYSNDCDRYMLDWIPALRLGIRLVEYSLRCAWYKKRKRAPKSFKPWFK